MTDISTHTVVLKNMWKCRHEATESFPHALSNAPVLWCEFRDPWCASPLTALLSPPLQSFRHFKAVPLHFKSHRPRAAILYTDPNSAIQASYFSRSAAETDFEIFLSVRVKSSMVTGICSSSLDRARISSGLRPWIRRRIAIMEASLMQRQRGTRKRRPLLIVWADETHPTLMTQCDTENVWQQKMPFFACHSLLACRKMNPNTKRRMIKRKLIT